MSLRPLPVGRVPAAPMGSGAAMAWRRALPWVALVALLLVAQGALLWLARLHEVGRAQEEVDAIAVNAATEISRVLAGDTQALQTLLWQEQPATQWRPAAQTLLRERHEIMRVELRDPDFAVLGTLSSPYHPAAFRTIARSTTDADAAVACTQARRAATPWFSRTYFVPLGDGTGVEVADVCVPWQDGATWLGSLVATVVLAASMEQAVSSTVLNSHEMSLVEPDGTRLARIGARRGAGRFVAERLVDLPGLRLPMRVDSVAAAPRLIPNPITALVLGLSLALALVVVLLVRDVRRRSAAERSLAEALAFRKAMEDSLVTGLRARDLDGAITYVNPAFCDMVGCSADELIGSHCPPYWPPELVDEYTRRQAARWAGDTPPREGFETTFMRRNGERFPVRIFEAPLVDGSGHHTGWMSAVLDVAEQRRVEELSRQQQERLQASARLATLGEMASLLSHELNQPLAAIASYAAGTLNLMPAQAPAPDPASQQLIRQALERMAEQADRAGRVIRSVHDFVRRRGQVREPMRADRLVEAVLPLVRLAARKSGTLVEVVVLEPAATVVCDTTMLEQVILNLTRNAIQSMEDAAPPAARVLTLRVGALENRQVSISVIDRGPGISEQVAARLFTPFFTTKADGMGMGLSLCRTVIEQHGGTLMHRSPLGPHGGTEFTFTLAAIAAEPSATLPSTL